MNYNTKYDWDDLLKRLKASGIGVTAFAKKEGIHPSSIYGRIRQEEQKAASKTETKTSNGHKPTVKPMTSGFTRVGEPSFLEVVKGTTTIKVPVDLDVSVLRSILEVLSE